MNVTYEHKPAMTLIGFSTTIRQDEGYTKCPAFWETEYNQKYVSLWQTMQPETAVERALLENRIGMFAICEQKAGCFDNLIAGLYRGGEVPEGLKLFPLPEGDWVVFSARGPMPGALQELNTAVWQEWYPNEGQQYTGHGHATLEVYSAGDMKSPDYECGIWVPVCKQGESAQIAAAALLGIL